MSILGSAPYNLLCDPLGLCLTLCIIRVISVNGCCIEVLVIVASQSELLFIDLELIPRSFVLLKREVIASPCNSLTSPN